MNNKKDVSCILYEKTIDDLTDNTADNLDSNILADTRSGADDVLHNTPAELYDEIPSVLNKDNPVIPDKAHFIYDELDDHVSLNRSTESKPFSGTTYLLNDDR